MEHYNKYTILVENNPWFLELFLTIIGGVMIALLAFSIQEYFKKRWERKKFLINGDFTSKEYLIKLLMFENSFKQFTNNANLFFINAPTPQTISFPEYKAKDIILDNIPLFLISKKNEKFKNTLFTIQENMNSVNLYMEQTADIINKAKEKFLKNEHDRDDLNDIYREIIKFHNTDQFQIYIENINKLRSFILSETLGIDLDTSLKKTTKEADTIKTRIK